MTQATHCSPQTVTSQAAGPEQLRAGPWATEPQKVYKQTNQHFQQNNPDVAHSSSCNKQWHSSPPMHPLPRHPPSSTSSFHPFQVRHGHLPCRLLERRHRAPLSLFHAPILKFGRSDDPVKMRVQRPMWRLARTSVQTHGTAVAVRARRGTLASPPAFP